MFRFLHWFFFRASWTAKIIWLVVVAVVIIVFGYRDGELLKMAGQAIEKMSAAADERTSPVLDRRRSCPNSRPSPPCPWFAGRSTPQTPTPAPSTATPPTAAPAPVEIYTPTIEADVYATSGPSHISFRVSASEYDFTSKHIIGLDDAATKDVDIQADLANGEYTVNISSPVRPGDAGRGRWRVHR